jgi:Recombination protein O N terminal
VRWGVCGGKQSVAGSGVCTLKTIVLVLTCRALSQIFDVGTTTCLGEVVIDGPCSSEAVVLKSYPLRESDLIAVLYTRRYGRVSVELG